jgi:hypothetical protein
MPRGWSTTEEHSVYEALPTILAEYQQAQRALSQTCSSCVAQRVRTQQVLSQLRRMN